MIDSNSYSIMTKRDLLLREMELISRIVERLSNHGLTTKQIAITSWMAATGFALKNDVKQLHLVALIASFVFWQLDAHFLVKERLLRRRYQQIASALAANSEHPAVEDPLCLTANNRTGWWTSGIFEVWAFLSRSLWPIYLTMAMISFLAWKRVL